MGTGVSSTSEPRLRRGRPGGGGGLPFSNAGLEPCLLNALFLSVGDCWLMGGSSPLPRIPGGRHTAEAAACAAAPGLGKFGGVWGSILILE